MIDPIDRQAALKAMDTWDKFGCDPDGKLVRYDDDKHVPYVHYDDMVHAIKHLPSAQQWILCSERLPEENDYKPCQECLDGAVWYFTENGAMGLGYRYESTKEWSTTDDLKTDGKVVAWMPLPEPYKGEE